MLTMNTQLQQVYEYLRMGQKQHAANLLTLMVASDPHNIEAWRLLAESASDVATVKRALHGILRITPTDVHARQMLDDLNRRENFAHMRQTAERHVMHVPEDSALIDFRRPQLRRPKSERMRLRAKQEREQKAFRAIIGVVAVIGLLGCALLMFAAMGGFGVIEQAWNRYVPRRASAATTAEVEISTLEHVSMLGNLAYFQWRSGTLASPQEQHAYTFTGRAGDLVVIELVAVTNTLNPALALYGPDQQEIGNRTDISPTDTNARITLNLPADGTYTILAVGQGGTQGQYQLNLRRG